MSWFLRKATVRNVNRAIREVNAFEWEGDYRPAVRHALKQILEGRMEEELGIYLGRGSYERRGQGDRADYRNGGYLRHVLTEVGDIVLKVPRSRKGFVTRVLEAYRRRARSIDQLIMACFILGMSTRKVSEALVCLLGERVSAQTVSRVAFCLDREVKKYHQRKLRDSYRFIFFDGVVLRHKGVSRVHRRVVLCSYGIGWDGRKQIIDFLLATSESQNGWEGFLRDLYGRGLEGKRCELIVTDGGKGLLGALEIVYPYISRQHCWAHKSRNVLDRVKKVDQKRVKRDLHRISHAQSRQQAIEAYWDFCQKYRTVYPSAVKSLEREIDDLLCFYQLRLSQQEKKGLASEQLHRAQQSLWRKVRTTNLIERAFREVRRRTRPMGVFNNRSSMERIIFAVFYYLNHKGQEGSPLPFTQEC